MAPLLSCPECLILRKYDPFDDDTLSSEEQEAASNAKPKSSSGISCRGLWKLKFIAIAYFLLLLKGMMIPSVPYIINTFFAASHGGGDCEKNPESTPCKQGATDSAVWHGCSEAVSNTIAMLMAVTLGACSDRTGRLPILQASSVLSVMAFSLMAMHVLFGWSLYFYLVAMGIVEAFDANGVIIAMVLDVPNIIPNADERWAAWKALGLLLLPLTICKMIISCLIPDRLAVTVSLVGAWLHLSYMMTCFPETAEIDQKKVSPSLSTVVEDVKRIFGRNSFIRRVGLALAVLGFAGAGCSVIYPPFMTGRLGVKKKDRLSFMFVIGPIMGAWFAGMGTLRDRIGDVGILRLSLAASAIMPVAFLACNQYWHFLLMCSLLMGPVALSFPTFVRLKSLLVAEDEQGVAQGATAGIGKGAATFGLLFFGWLFRSSTHGGKDLQGGLVAPFLANAATLGVAFLLVCSLPTELPPTPRPVDTDGKEQVMGKELSNDWENAL